MEGTCNPKGNRMRAKFSLICDSDDACRIGIGIGVGSYHHIV